ncbi:MAG: PatB family C-S lyase [Candidatus Cloacimonetes bacterium]|nr:PatB family C-S lyase [Candidatus Cloacimonadota bacterium]MCF7815215.1 PatB family C-S lyase [Candidatus Cloacimonadota bacterium]MCF7869385.1 PatB family C-S lyase [Candidatus Cloacimonadota bacterium]
MKYDFDKMIDRKNTNCYKWDFTKEMFGTDDIIPLWVADTDFAAPEPVVDKLVERAKHGVYGYSFEPEEYFQVFIDWLDKRFNWKIEKEWIINTTGIVPAINFAIQAFTKPDDKILVQTPVYFPFFESIKKNDREVVNSQLKLVGNRYEIDFKDLENKLKADVKMMLFCSPHNPVGRVWTKSELEKVATLCLDNNVLLISDEIHSDLILSQYKHIPTASMNKKIADNIISMYAPSKTFNVAGLSTSTIVIPNKHIRYKFQKLLEKLGLHLINVFGIEAFIAAYKDGEEWLEQLLKYIENNYHYVKSYLEENIPKISAIEMEGTYLMWLDCRKLNLSQNDLVGLFINKAKVGLNDGKVFGAGGEGFMRLNIGCPRSLLEEALERIKNAIT